MRDSDGINRFVIENADVRGMLVQLDDTWLAARERMQYPARVSRVLGEAFAAAVLLSTTIKYSGKLTLQIRGHGPVHLLVVQVTSEGTVRGLARWGEEPQADSLQALFGDDARMTISVEADALGEPHQGIVGLHGEKLSDALGDYFLNSEQLQTKLYLAVNEQSAAGLLLQKLPQNEAESGIDQDGWNRVLHIANTVDDKELLSLDASALLHRLFHEEQVRLFAPATIKFQCSCSRERTDGLILGLGEAEALDILKDEGNISITCEFCAASYVYDSVDVGHLFRVAENSAENTGAVNTASMTTGDPDMLH